ILPAIPHAKGGETMTTRTDRTTHAVFDDHLALRKQGETESDIKRSYAPDVVLLTGDGIHRGHDGVRETASISSTSCRTAPGSTATSSSRATMPSSSGPP